MDELRLPARLEQSRRVLVAGAGGGFDVYTGLLIYERLRGLGKEVFLANLSFTYLGGTNARQLTRALYAVDSDTSGCEGYFPERTLARFLSRRGDPVRVYTFAEGAFLGAIASAIEGRFGDYHRGRRTIGGKLPH